MTAATANPAGRLRDFQDGFAAALAASLPLPDGAIDASPEIARLVAQPGFAVYRNTVLKGCIDALQANYPAVSRLVGDEWFRAAAAIFARAHPPRHPSLLDYGSDFAAFLAAFEPAAELPYLAGVARLDRHWTEAHAARDETPVAAGIIAALSPEQLPCVALRPHASARWAWFDDAPILTIWDRNRAPDPMPDSAVPALPDLDWRAEGVLITRPGGAVQWAPLSHAGCAFLDACAGGGTLAAAAAAALCVEPLADLAALMALTLAAGAFGRVDLHHDHLQGPAR